MEKIPFTKSLLLLIALSLVSCAARIGIDWKDLQEPYAKNVILFIGDGMGFEHIKAAGMFENGKSETLSFEFLPHQAGVKSLSVNREITDSASAGTAMATGVKVYNGVISMSLPGNGSSLKTILEYCKEIDRSTGLVTTTFITHATPAAFGAHEPTRHNYLNIASDYLTETRPNILFGGAKYISHASAEKAGYVVIKNQLSLSELDTENVSHVSGQFGFDHMPYETDGLGTLPHLTEMTKAALDILDNDPDGFFLMVEGGRIDHASHNNDIQRAIYETVEFSHAVQSAIDWATGRDDTLIIVTADHETGGLTVLNNNGQGNIPDVRWSTTDHTDETVPVFAWGVNSHLIRGLIDNTDIFLIINPFSVFAP